MSATAALFIALVVWLAIGAITSIVMARRGHDPYWWAALGALWGPLVVPVAISAGRDEREVKSGLVSSARGLPVLDHCTSSSGSTVRRDPKPAHCWRDSSLVTGSGS